MRQASTLSLTVAAILTLAAGPASAETEVPRVKEAHWTNHGVDFGEGIERVMIVRAVDPDGVISEVVVDWGDGSVIFAHTYCVQGEEVGLPARLYLSHAYTAQGRYQVRIVAISKPACDEFEGYEESATVHLPTLVRS